MALFNVEIGIEFTGSLNVPQCATAQKNKDETLNLYCNKNLLYSGYMD